ncbi:MAG TPA: ferrous iron transport protein B [Candidatus Hydrogenedens sp.]|nr:ferrous iron transport protein B [Candidatus Hydrogenedens sp.]
MAYTRRTPSRQPRVIIVGNPNSGKSSIFNDITGEFQEVSNYPGVTVERAVGFFQTDGIKIRVEDLPGIYSLTPYTDEERIAREEILSSDVDLIINVVDTSNLERSLYLTTQIVELGKPFIIVLNMSDLAEKRGIHLNYERLSCILNVPVIKTVGNRGEGIKELEQAILMCLNEQQKFIPNRTTYGHEVDNVVDSLSDLLTSQLPEDEKGKSRWYAVKLLEKDPQTLDELKNKVTIFTYLEKEIEKQINEIEQHENEDSSVVIALRRYGFISGALRECVSYTGGLKQNITEKIDNIVCNRIIGPLILVGVIGLMFFVVLKTTQEWEWIPFTTGWVSPVGLFEEIFELTALLFSFLEKDYPALHSLITDGVIGGVGAVLSFIPLIFILFLLISWLEDTGYIARIAFIMDRLMRIFGLQGRSVLALIISGGIGAGGCAVPGILATRTFQERKDKIITMLVVPFMSCGAKLPVYALLIAAFFQHNRTFIMLTLWVISWIVALISAFILSRFVIRGEQIPFVLELPPYHIPVFRSVLRHAWGKTWLYIRKAGTLILAVNIIMWALIYIPLPFYNNTQTSERNSVEHSVAGIIGKAIEPVTKYVGFDWKINIALIGGMAAKEVIVGTLGTVYNMEIVDDEQSSLSTVISNDKDWYPLRALTLMIFVMLYAPCVATLVTMWSETGTIRFPLFSLFFSTTAAFVVSLIVFHIGHLLSFGT